MKNLIPKRVMEYIIITFAVVLMDVGIYVFKFPNNFSFGGVSGMAVVFSHFIPMTSAQINLVINLILLVIGFIVLGRDFGVKTAYVTVVSSLLLNVFEKVFPMDRALTGNIMLELCFAIILPALAAALLERGFDLVTGGTDNHLMLADLRKKNITGKDLQIKLDEVHITVNKNAIPNDPQKPGVTSGVRIGTPACTTRGFTPEDMPVVADCIDKIATDFESNRKAVLAAVAELVRKHPIYE